MDDNLLISEMRAHLCLDNVTFEKTDSMVPFFAKYCKCSSIDGSQMECVHKDSATSTLCYHGMTENRVMAVLGVACKVFYACSRLRIDPGIVTTSDYFYTPDKTSNGAEDMLRSSDIVVLIRNPKVLIHLVNCECVDELMKNLSEMQSAEEVDMPEVNDHKKVQFVPTNASTAPKTFASITRRNVLSSRAKPCTWRTEAEQNKQVEICNMDDIVQCSHCYTHRAIENLRILAERIMDDDRLRLESVWHHTDKDSISTNVVGYTKEAVSRCSSTVPERCSG